MIKSRRWRKVLLAYKFVVALSLFIIGQEQRWQHERDNRLTQDGKMTYQWEDKLRKSDETGGNRM